MKYNICTYCGDPYIPKYRVSKSRARLYCTRDCANKRALREVLKESFPIGRCLIFQGANLYFESNKKRIQVARAAFEAQFNRPPIGRVTHSCKDPYCMLHLEDQQFRKYRK